MGNKHKAKGTEIPLSETVRTMADTILMGKGKVIVTFEPSFLYEVANALSQYESRDMG